ncbi:MAG: phosphatidate cytidylyltransferase [Eubacteriales bacterium]
MKTRVLAAGVMLPILLLILLVLPVIWATCLVAIISAIAARELLHTTKLVTEKRVVIYAMVMAVATSFWSYFGNPIMPAMASLWVFLMVLIMELLANHGSLQFEKVCLAAVAGIVVPLCFSSVVRILLSDYGRYYMMTVMIMTSMSDTGGYFAGRFIGKHKLAPIISPKKTVEGAIGSLVMVVATLLVYGLILENVFHLNYNYGLAFVYGILGAVSSIEGDLAFSVIKRQSGIKDFGNLIPGHGGILDRFDSTITTAPLAEILMILIPIIGA